MERVEGISHEVDRDQVLHIVFDNPGEKVNTLNADRLRYLTERLDEARSSSSIRAVLFRSAKPEMFLAGMDVDQIAAVTDAHVGADGARQGQAVFQKIEDLGKPTAAAIAGTCLGGGTELVLACDAILMTDDAGARIGLPEVQLGIIPGFGGTQRLPRRAGLLAALDMILTGRAVVGKKAQRIGLVDRVVPAAYLDREAQALLVRAAEKGLPARRPLPLKDRLMGSIAPLRNFAMGKAAKKLESKVRRDQYPAPFRALEAIEAAFTRPLSEGLDLEARIIGELIPTPTAKNLMWLFKNQTALKSDEVVRAVPRRVDKVGVLGAGIMGGGIAQLVADKGLPVRLKDIRHDAVETALQTAAAVWQRKVDRRRLTRNGFADKMGFIAPTLDYSGFRNVDVVIEAVVENLAVKQSVIEEVEQRIDERAVLASNTSSIPISEIAARARRPERIVGMHFFNPVHRMPLVEVIAGRHSTPEAIATVHKLAIRLGKVPVLVNECPGFLVNRILGPYLFEAMLLLRDGSRIETIDGAMKEFGMPMGPCALMDQVGLDTANHASAVFRKAFGDRVGTDEVVLGKLVELERYGAKSGRGFYRYSKGKATEPDPEVYKLAGQSRRHELPAETLQERMVLAMINEAALCLQEGVVRSARDVDMAMVMGTGFPPFRGGLLRHADSIGIPIVVDRLARLADAQGARFRPAQLLEEMVRGQRRFYQRNKKAALPG